MPFKRYPHDNLLLKPRSLPYLWRLLFPTLEDFLWFLGTIAVIAACVFIGWYESTGGSR